MQKVVRRKSKSESPIPKRRRYDAKTGIEKIVQDLTAIAAHQKTEVLPTQRALCSAGYENLSFVMADVGYMALCEACGLRPETDYYDSTENVRDEINRIFVRPQWDLVDDDAKTFEERLPDYAELAAQPDLYAGVVRAGGMSQIFPPDWRFFGLKPGYYTNDENLKAEMEIWMKRLRTKHMPAFAQLEHRNSLMEEAILVRGGYVATAALLGLTPHPNYLREPRNLWLELYLVEVQSASRRHDRRLESGLPDCYLDYMPSEREIRALKRLDLHKAIEARGGYYQTAKELGLWLPARFWEANPTLGSEMRRIAALLKRPRMMPTVDDLKEVGRPDLAKGIAQNGGYRRAAEMCRLQPQKSKRRDESPIPAKKNAPFLPYPFRRFAEGPLKVAEWQVSLEIAPKSKGASQIEEYGVWLLASSAQPLTAGRVGWIRRRPGTSEIWWHRLEGDSNWSGKPTDTRPIALEALLERSISATAQPS